MSISRSVGSGGANLPADVRLVQEAINLSRTDDRLPPIAVDGIVGPETIGAIQAFQGKHRLPVRDGRIDPDRRSAQELDKIVREYVLGAISVILAGLYEDLDARNLSLKADLQNDFNVLYHLARTSPRRIADQGVKTAVYYPQLQHPRFRLAVAAALPAAAAAGAAEIALAALLAILATLAILVLIQTAPAMGRALEDLMRQVQILMSKLIEQVEEAIEGIEDLIKKNTQAGMKCSAVLIAFRQISKQLLDLLKAPRAPDDISRARFKKQLVELFQKWQDALAELLACLAANGVPLPV